MRANERRTTTCESVQALKEYRCDGNGSRECDVARRREAGCVMGEVILNGTTYIKGLLTVDYNENFSSIKSAKWVSECPHKHKERLLWTRETMNAQQTYTCDGDGTWECKQACRHPEGCVLGEMIHPGDPYVAEISVIDYLDMNNKKRSRMRVKRWRLDCPHYQHFDDDDLLLGEEEKNLSVDKVNKKIA